MSGLAVILAWLHFAPDGWRQVLGFSGYFREEVPNSALETWRVRRVAIRWVLRPCRGMRRGIRSKHAVFARSQI